MGFGDGMLEGFKGRGFYGCTAEYSEADTVLFGAPLDVTTSFRSGTRFAAGAIRNESIGVEWYSPYFDRDLSDIKVCDYGDLDLPTGVIEPALDMIGNAAKKIHADNKRPFMIGGEHLVTLPAFRAAIEKYPDICVIHFDAHTDLRESFWGSDYSHATVLRKVWDLTGDGRIFQFGIRSGAREEFYWAAEGHTFLNKYDFTGLEEAVRIIGNRPVYFTLDIDVLDPSVMPGTGTTEGGGVTFKELMNALKTISPLNIVAMDLVELSPHYDHSGASTAIACKLVREMLLMN